METTISNHAAAAKAIKQEIKKAFPAIKFSVKSKSYSGGDSDVEGEFTEFFGGCWPSNALWRIEKEME